jgi:addiction module HigA family antidote
MEMKNPPHPGELIGDSLEELGMSISAAAKGLGITRQQLHNLIAGRSGVTPEMAVRFEKALGSSADTWLRMQMNYDLAQIRKRASSIIGIGGSLAAPPLPHHRTYGSVYGGSRSHANALRSRTVSRAI